MLSDQRQVKQIEEGALKLGGYRLLLSRQRDVEVRGHFGSLSWVDTSSVSPGRPIFDGCRYASRRS
jgi:hypothetical protein